MPRTFTNEEYADFHFIYGFANGNAEEAVREYRRRYPNRRQPNANVFIETHRRFRLFGLKQYLENHDRRNERHRNEILRAFDDDPRLSTRRASRQLGVSKSKILRVLHWDGRNPYHLQPVQNLLPGDAERRLNFYQWLFEFLLEILWTDEATFTRRGVVNFHNLDIWSQENPHEIRSHF
uniref:DUF4817 domain-containing protein n=1 Tax=Anoplophora glabripennis TaxID=217634 RepID=V5G098_ANOGL